MLRVPPALAWWVLTAALQSTGAQKLYCCPCCVVIYCSVTSYRLKQDTFIINIWQFLCQESGRCLAGWFWPKISHETLVEGVEWGCCYLKAQLGQVPTCSHDGWKPLGYTGCWLEAPVPLCRAVYNVAAGLPQEWGMRVRLRGEKTQDGSHSPFITDSDMTSYHFTIFYPLEASD